MTSLMTLVKVVLTSFVPSSINTAIIYEYSNGATHSVETTRSLSSKERFSLSRFVQAYLLVQHLESVRR